MQFFKFLLVFFSLTLSAQNSVPVVFVKPMDHNQFTSNHYKIIIDKLLRAYNGKKVFTNQSPFEIIPNLTLINTYEAGEIQMSKVVKIDLSIQLKDSENSIVFGEYNTTITGTGNTEMNAISKAVQQMKFNNQKIQDFFLESNNDIINFYRENCDQILKVARVNIKRKEYVKASNALKYVPIDTQCYMTVENLLTEIYTETKDQSCLQLFQQANIYESKGDYDKALELLSYIDSVSECMDNATNLINKIGASISEDKKRKFEFEREKFSKLTDLQKYIILSEKVDYLQINL